MKKLAVLATLAIGMGLAVGAQAQDWHSDGSFKFDHHRSDRDNYRDRNDYGYRNDRGDRDDWRRERAEEMRQRAWREHERREHERMERERRERERREREHREWLERHRHDNWGW